MSWWATSQADTVSGPDEASRDPWQGVRITIKGSSSVVSDVVRDKPAPTEPAANEPHSAADEYSSVPMGRDGRALTPDQVALAAKIRKTLALYEPKRLNARDHSSWEVMHSLIAYGPRTEIFRDGPGGQTVNAMGWLCWGGRCQGQPLIMLENGHPHALRGVGLQGHEGQYLGMLAQWRVRPESAMKIDGKDFTINDLIEEEKATCESGTELTFKLIALAHYLPSDATWKSRNGEDWSIPKLIKAEIEAPIHGAACGGTHRLFGISNAVKIRQQRGEPIDGQWARAQKYIIDYERYTVGSLQNRDGSFSTEWFNRPADRQGDIDRKLQTTGHMLEWLTWALPSDDLRDPRVMKATDFLCGILLENPDKSWSIGPLGHGLHSLMIYHQRMYTDPALPETTVAAHESVPLRTAARPVGTTQNPPEPDCGEQSFDSMTPEKLRELAEQSDNCVDSDQLHAAMRKALLEGAPARDPVTRPASVTN